MKKVVFALALIVVCYTLFAMDATTLLVGIDKNRKVGDQFGFKMTVSSFVDDKVYESHGLYGYVTVEANRKTRSLIYFDSPANVKNRKMYIEQNYIWVLFPRTKNAIRLSPLQILLGEVAYGDILQLSYSTDYDIESYKESARDDEPVFDIILKVKKEARGSTYGTIHLWVEKETLAPVCAEFYSESGKLIKTAIYRNTQKVMNAYASMEIEIRDAVKTNRYSVMKYEKIVPVKLPDSNFNKEYLQRFELIPLE